MAGRCSQSFPHDLVCRYQVGTGIGGGKVNTKGDYDYLAVRIPNHDAWYLVPLEELLHSANDKSYPNISKSKGQFVRFRYEGIDQRTCKYPNAGSQTVDQVFLCRHPSCNRLLKQIYWIKNKRNLDLTLYLSPNQMQKHLSSLNKE